MEGLSLVGLSWQPPKASAAVVCGVDLHAPGGQVLGLIGPSGAGKTSLLRLIAGLETPSAGRIVIEGVDVTGWAASDRPVGLVAQDPLLFPELSALDNVAFRLRLKLPQASDAVERARGALRLLGAEHLAARRPGELSEGERQRIGLARALVDRPAVLLLDEPIVHLDRGLRRVLREEIRALQAQLRLTVVYVTHDQPEAMAVSDQLVLLHQGRVIQHGSPRQLYTRPVSAFAAAFMGEMRLFEAWRAADGLVHLGSLRLALGDGLPEGPVRLVVRPEAWRIVPAHAPGLASRVLRSACTGPHIEYELASPWGDVLVRTPRTSRRHETGAPVSLSLTPHGAWVLPGADDGDPDDPLRSPAGRDLSTAGPGPPPVFRPAFATHRC